MGDNDQNRFQTEQTDEVANEIVAEQVDTESIASQLHNNNDQIMKKGEWAYEEKMKMVQINREERQKGKNFMKRMKQQWDIDYPQK